MKTRNFEVGDLVVSETMGIGRVYDIQMNYARCEFKNNFWSYSIFGDNSDIKTIRKPLPGSQEARKIVWMLAIKYRKSHKEKGRIPEYKGWYRSWINYSPLASVFYAAKDMLK